MKELLENILKQLVDSPEQVEVKEIDSEKITVYELRVAQADIGKVIGKEGRTINAIRTVVSCASAKKNKRIMVEVV